MASRRRQSGSYSARRGRSRTASGFHVSPLPRLSLPVLNPVEDRRTYHPLGGFRPALLHSGTRARIVADTRVQRARRRRLGVPPWPSPVITFDDARRVLICARRKARKEVLFARKKAGRGGQKKPHYNWFSRVSCKG